METSTSRVLWKGAISFGLVHIPVALHSATSKSGLDFAWLDKRTMDPIGYKRINKKSGKEVEKENIVKGISYEEGQPAPVSAPCCWGLTMRQASCAMRAGSGPDSIPGHSLR